MIGFNGSDTLIGKAGNDTINGGKGDDLIDGGDGADLIEGGLGIDDLNGQAGNDTIKGGEGDDSIDGGDGDDLIEGGLGIDFLNGIAGSDTMQGGKGDDVYYVDNDQDIVHEEENHGNDTIYSYSAKYTLPNNSENLILMKSTGTEGLGNNLDNQITGSTGNDIVSGGEGNDSIIGGQGGEDTYNGGAGKDKLILNDLDDFVLFDGERSGSATNSLFNKKKRKYFIDLKNIEGVDAGGGDDIIAANQKNLIGKPGNDIKGGGGNDTIQASAGQDTIDGGSGLDKLFVYDSDKWGYTIDVNKGLATGNPEKKVVSKFTNIEVFEVPNSQMCFLTIRRYEKKLGI